ncbi:MAG: hypothetical protein K9G63_16375, partial [Melioribacteraceae bacterium]|nr:hypothetical protein [Melioribacteraceae bacterium]
MLKRYFTFLFLFIVGISFAQNVNVSFNVDMRVPILKGDFFPSDHQVSIRGNFNDWGETIMQDVDEDSIYSIQITISETPTYKYFHTNGDTWENDPNRTFSLPTIDTTVNDGFNREFATGAEASVTFEVDMTKPIRDGLFDPFSHTVWIAGNFNGWGNVTTEMFDDNSDSVYTVVVDTLTGGYSAAFKFIYNDGGIQWEGGSDRTFLVLDGENYFYDYWDRVDPSSDFRDGNIFFEVDMSVMTDVGLFNNIADSPRIRGGFNGWSDSDPDRAFMQQDFLDPDYWSINVPFEQVQFEAVQEYKYFVAVADPGTIWIDGYERPLSRGGGNRQVVFQGTEAQEAGMAYYDDVHPDYFVPEGQSLSITFSVDMEPATDPELQAIPFYPAEDELFWIAEQPAFAALMGWADSDTMKYFQLTDDDGDLVYTGTLTVNGPGWNGFEYRYAFKDISEDAFTQEPAGFGAFNYRVRYVGQNAPRSFPVNPWTMPQDVWTNSEDKSDQFETDPFSSLGEYAEVTVVAPDMDEIYNSSHTITEVPITVSNLDGYEVISYQFTMEYDTSLVDASSINIDGTLSNQSGWSVLPNTLVDGEITVGAFGANPLSGEGELIKVVFEMTGVEG